MISFYYLMYTCECECERVSVCICFQTIHFNPFMRLLMQITNEIFATKAPDKSVNVGQCYCQCEVFCDAFIIDVASTNQPPALFVTLSHSDDFCMIASEQKPFAICFAAFIWLIVYVWFSSVCSYRNLSLRYSLSALLILVSVALGLLSRHVSSSIECAPLFLLPLFPSFLRSCWWCVCLYSFFLVPLE